MIKKAAILFPSFGPYHKARVSALANQLAEIGISLVAFRFSERSDTYGWQPETPKDVAVITLEGGEPQGWQRALGLAYRLFCDLRNGGIQTVFLPSFSPLPNLLCFLASKIAGCRTVLMTESWYGTEQASMLGKMLKHVLVRLFDSALVGGIPQTDYVAGYGMEREKIFTGYDVVDVEHFAQTAKRWSEEVDPPIKGLPARYFLNLGRFVEKKNISTLVSAYARFTKGVAGDEPSKIRNGMASVALVLVGEGPLREALQMQAQELGLSVRDGAADPIAPGGAEVVFYPFQQADLTPFFFAKCETFVLPSSREEWGLVVNEAMACGAAVIASNRTGAHFDLVEDGVNGFTFSPQDVDQLTELLGRFARDPGLRDRFGKAGRERIGAWSPNRFGRSGVQALRATHKV